MIFKKINLLFAAFLIVLLLPACDIIEEPYMTGPGNGNQNGEVVRKVLLHEIGHYFGIDESELRRLGY